MAKPCSINKTASTTEANVEKVFYEIKVLRNMGSVDILLNFDKPIVGEDYYRLEAGATIEDWDIVFGKLYYKTESGTANFYLIGTNSNT